MKIHTVVICGCGFPNYENNFEGISRLCELSFENLYVPESPLMNKSLAKLMIQCISLLFRNLMDNIL